MCSCNCFPAVIETDYGSLICRGCGLETPTGLLVSDKYTSNSPLHVGYHRVCRVKNILDQLFEPQLYCYPSSEVLYNIYASRLEVADGVELLTWLGKLALKNKKYNACHYYFMFANRPYIIPKPPAKETYFKILRDFYIVESIFRCQKRKKTSFFSYNWLIRRLLTNNNQEYYTQFLKPIKCKHRRAQYEKMYNSILKIANTHSTGRVGVSSFHRSPFVSPDGARLYPRRRQSCFSDPAVRSLLSTQGLSP
jgi:hypothetical protein